MKLLRREFLHLAAGAAALPAMSRVAAAESYPSQPVRVVVGYPPGLSPDILARLAAEAYSKRLGQQFVVDDRPGAAGNIGTEIAAHATPDGYTLMFTVSANAINKTLYPHVNYDFARDLTPVARLGLTPFIIVVHPSFAPRSVAELIAYAKANPGKINAASAGAGTGPHVACELFKMMTQTDIVQIPYKANYMPDLLGGQIPMAFAPIAQIISDVKAGNLIALGATTPDRSDAAPEIPAIAETVPGYAASGWYGISAPTGTPADIIDKLNETMSAAVTEPAFKARLLNLGVVPAPLPVAAFRAFVTEEIAKYAKVISFANITVE